MKKLSIFTIILFALGLYMVPATFASTDSKDKQAGQSGYQQDQKGQSQAQQGQQLQQQSLVMLENLNGAEVLNPQGENIGEFENVLVDMETGQIAFVTLTSGGVLGVGEDTYIVPFNALKNETPGRTDGVMGLMTQMRFTLNKSKDQLKRVPEGGIEEALSQQNQRREIHEFYGVAPYWEDNQRQQRQDNTQRQMMERKDQQQNQKKN